MIRKFIEKQKIKRVFKKLVTPEHVEEILSDKFALPKCQQGRIEFIVTFVRDESPDDVFNRISQVVDLARIHKAMFHDIIGAVVIVAFGTHPTAAIRPDNRLLLVQSLRQELGNNIKIVHGAADGHYGLFGSEKLFSYTFLEGGGPGAGEPVELEVRNYSAIPSWCHNLTRFSGN